MDSRQAREELWTVELQRTAQWPRAQNGQTSAKEWVSGLVLQRPAPLLLFHVGPRGFSARLQLPTDAAPGRQQGAEPCHPHAAPSSTHRTEGPRTPHTDLWRTPARYLLPAGMPGAQGPAFLLHPQGATAAGSVNQAKEKAFSRVPVPGLGQRRGQRVPCLGGTGRTLDCEAVAFPGVLLRVGPFYPACHQADGLGRQCQRSQAIPLQARLEGTV